MVIMSSYTHMAFCIPDLGQIAHVGEHMDLLQGVEETVFLFLVADLRDRALLIIDVTEHDGIGRTSLLAGGLDVPFTIRARFQGTIFFLRLEFAFLQTLNTEGTLLDHTT